MSINRRNFLKLGAATSSFALFDTTQLLANETSGTRYAMIVDLRKCIACQACTVGCGIENQTPVGNFRTVVDELVIDRENYDTSYINLPRLCNHCTDAPCIDVCPTNATFKDGKERIVVDSHQCIGCGFCVEACPYDARFINKETKVADKCTFCAHRMDEGLLPACVETCVANARVIGDINDKNSKVREILSKHQVSVLKKEAGTKPNVFYIGIEEYLANRNNINNLDAVHRGGEL